MTFKAYRAATFSHAHENLAFNQLYDILKNQWASKDEPLHLFGNFYVDGKEIDALIVKRNAVIVIDFKDYGGSLSVSENGRWLINNVEVRGGSKANPYQQIRDNKFSLLGYLQRHIEFQSKPNWGHIAGLCLFHKEIEFDPNTLSANISKWFHISDLKSVVRMVDAIVSPQIKFSNRDLNYLISILNVPEYFPDGHAQEIMFSEAKSYEKHYRAPLSGEQTKAYTALKDFFADDKTRVFSLSGAFYTGTQDVLKHWLNDLSAKNSRVIFLAPNKRLAGSFTSNGFISTSSIYNWLYAARPEKIEKDKQVYPVDREDLDPTKDILIIFEAHLLSEDYFDTDTARYGSGYILQDLLNSLTHTKSEDKEKSQQEFELSQLPKIVLMGDPYQLTRGAKDKSFLSGHIFLGQSIKVSKIELKSQHRDAEAPIERLDFQKHLVDQLMAQKFTRLPRCEQQTIKTIRRGQHTDSIAMGLLEWPRNSVYLCATNAAAQAVNLSVRRNYLGATNPSLLVVGDIIDLHNRTKNQACDKLEEGDWLNSGEFARVLATNEKTLTKFTYLNGVKEPVIMEFANAIIEVAGRKAEICYIPDFLAAEKPELTIHQSVALRIWAREEAQALLADKKIALDKLDKNSAEFKATSKQYNDELNALILNSDYTNVARLRYAYALTVHRAQSYRPVPLVTLAGGTCHDTDNPATDSYFRWLYTSTVCTNSRLQILDYPLLTPLSKAQWHFDSARLVPVIFKQTFYYDQHRKPTEEELRQPLPEGFSNTDPRLLALLLTIYELVDNSGWNIKSVAQHSYAEHYIFINDEAEVSVTFNYNSKFKVSIGQLKNNIDHQAPAQELKQLLTTIPMFQDKNIAMAVTYFSDHLAENSWSLIGADEKRYRVYLIVEHEVGRAKLMLDVPSDSSVSRNGVISHIRLEEADSEALAVKFKQDFANG